MQFSDTITLTLHIQFEYKTPKFDIARLRNLQLLFTKLATGFGVSILLMFDKCQIVDDSVTTKTPSGANIRAKCWNVMT